MSWPGGRGRALHGQPRWGTLRCGSPALGTSGPRARRAPWVLSRGPCLAPSPSLSRTPHRNDHMTAVNTAGRSGEVVGGPHRDRRADPGGRPFGDPPVGPYLRMRLAVGRDLDVAGRVVADDAPADGGVQRGPQGCSGRRRWAPPPATNSATGSPAPATGASTRCCTSWRSPQPAWPPQDRRVGHIPTLHWP